MNDREIDKQISLFTAERKKTIKQKMKRLKYLYRRRTKGVRIDLHTIDHQKEGESDHGQYRRIKQYEHYISKKIGFITKRREMLNETDNPDPTRRYVNLKTELQREEDQEFEKL